MKKNLKTFLILFICLIFLTGCSSNDNHSSIEEKNLAELEYLEDKVVLIMNKFIKNEYFDEENGNQRWDDILEDSRKIESAMATTLVDLATLNIDSAEVAKLSTEINKMIVAIENQDETNFVVGLNNIYALI